MVAGQGTKLSMDTYFVIIYLLLTIIEWYEMAFEDGGVDVMQGLS